MAERVALHDVTGGLGPDPEAFSGPDGDGDAHREHSFGRRFLSALWPKLLAAAIFLLFWQIVTWSNWRPEYVLPGPRTVLAELGHLITTEAFWRAVATTVRRQLFGYAIAILVGVAIAIPVARSRALRSAVGSLITGLQTMPSIAWFPLAILLFKITESAITFVLVLGAAPSIANGIIAGIDHIPPLWLRAARSLDARGFKLLRHVILPAAFPSMLAGLKQGWAFAWRSLMAGELIVIIANRPSLGARLQFARELSDAAGLLALMIVILVLGILADAVFTAVDQRVRARRGLLVTAS